MNREERERVERKIVSAIDVFLTNVTKKPWHSPGKRNTGIAAPSDAFLSDTKHILEFPDNKDQRLSRRS